MDKVDRQIDSDTEGTGTELDIRPLSHSDEYEYRVFYERVVPASKIVGLDGKPLIPRRVEKVEATEMISTVKKTDD